jgi:hypothetical protein
MKSLRIILGVFAFALAIGAGIASERLSQNPVYRFIDRAGINDDDCEPVNLTCDTQGSAPCKVSASDPQILRASTDPATGCGMELWKVN